MVIVVIDTKHLSQLLARDDDGHPAFFWQTMCFGVKTVPGRITPIVFVFLVRGICACTSGRYPVSRIAF